MKLGIVGLPNVGKSTLFNAITKAGAEAANYPFCTIEPNVGVVTVPDERLKVLHEMYNSKKTIYTTIEFYDIAGLVKGASKGEGLGNKFLGHIREVAAIVHVVRCFEDPNVVHVDGKIDPISDIETINTELILSDMEVLERRIQKTTKNLKGDKSLQKELDLLNKVHAFLGEGKSAAARAPEWLEILEVVARDLTAWENGGTPYGDTGDLKLDGRALLLGVMETRKLAASNVSFLAALEKMYLALTGSR